MRLMNNLQADSLKSLNLIKSDFLVSELIDIEDGFGSGDWLQIDAKSIKLSAVSDKKSKASARLKFKDGYFFIDLKPQKEVKFKEAKSFNIRIAFNYIDYKGELALSKMPLSADLYKGKKFYAKIELYFEERFYLKVV